MQIKYSDEVPDGYRKLKAGEKIEKTDCVFSKSMGFVLTTRAGQRVRPDKYGDAVYIRKAPKAEGRE